MAQEIRVTRAERSAANKAAYAAERAERDAVWKAKREHRVLILADRLPAIGAQIEQGTVESVGRIFPASIGLAAYVYYAPRAVPAAAAMQSAVDRVARAFAGRTRVRKPIGLLRFLAERGGLRDCPDLRSMNAEKCFVPGAGKLVRAEGKGLKLDHARELAEEAGYLAADSYVSDLLYWVDEALHGRDCYPADQIGDMVESEAWDASERDRRSYAENSFHSCEFSA